MQLSLLQKQEGASEDESERVRDI